MDIEEALNEIDLRVCDLANSIKKYQDYIDGVKEPTLEHLILATMMVITKSVVCTADAHIKEVRRIIKKPPAATDGMSKGHKVEKSL